MTKHDISEVQSYFINKDYDNITVNDQTLESYIEWLSQDNENSRMFNFGNIMSLFKER